LDVYTYIGCLHMYCACVCVTEMRVGVSKENVSLLGVSKENVSLLSVSKENV